MPDSESGKNTEVVAALTPALLLRHWLGHRRLTRRTIQLFPGAELFAHRAPGMRAFGAIVHELNVFMPLAVRGAATGEWSWPDGTDAAPVTKEELLRAFDEATRVLETYLPSISSARFLAVDQPIGSREEPVISTLLYFLDNEVHHRGQGFVYLRELGIEPPAFYQR